MALGFRPLILAQRVCSVRSYSFVLAVCSAVILVGERVERSGASRWKGERDEEDEDDDRERLLKSAGAHDAGWAPTRAGPFTRRVLHSAYPRLQGSDTSTILSLSLGRSVPRLTLVLPACTLYTLLRLSPLPWRPPQLMFLHKSPTAQRSNTRTRTSWWTISRRVLLQYGDHSNGECPKCYICLSCVANSVRLRQVRAGHWPASLRLYL